jgi:pilus assembly protein CpaE
MIRVLIADSNAASREQLRADLTRDPEIEIVGQASDGSDALQLAHQFKPDVAILDANLAVQDGFQTAEFITGTQYLPTLPIIISDIDTAEQLRRAMRSGAKDHLARPISPDVLVKTVKDIYNDEQRRHSPTFAQAADPKKTTRVFSLTGAKGGIGKTTLATNLAAALAFETGEPTALIDLYVQFGDVAMMLNLEQKRTLADLGALEPHEIDAQLLNDCMATHPQSGLKVLFCSKGPVALDAINVPLIEHVLGLMKQQYRYIIIDVPPILHTTTLYVLAHSTNVLVVANQFDITTINDTRQLLLTIQKKYVAKEKIRIVINRISKQNRLQIQEIEQALGYEVAFQIPNDGATVPTAVNQGMPFVLSNPATPVAQSIRSTARSLAGLISGEKTMVMSTDDLQAARKGGSFFGKR